MYNERDFFEELKKRGIPITQKQEEQIKKRINSMLSYRPQIGVLGKTGVGKSSLCNALFGKDLCPVSDVEACTRESQNVLISMGESGKGITLIDVPGVGENSMRDSEYSQLYSKLLPKLDIILWVLKADDRAYSIDEQFYKSVVKFHIDDNKPFFFVLNQIDKIDPFREWNVDKHIPSDKQLANINRKITDVANIFDVAPSKIIPVSAEEKYNLTLLVNEFIRALPRKKVISVYREVSDETKTQESEKYVKRSFFDAVGEFVVDAVDAAGEAVVEVVDYVREKVKEKIDKILNPCYITTAVCKSCGKPDDCYELTQLRKFRDEWLSKQPDGQALINKYYSDAPKIVRAIDSQSNSGNIYNDINNKYIKPCIEYIENNEPEKCKDLYVCMVNSLSEKYL